MSFKSFLSESLKHVKNGNGSHEVFGENIILGVWSDVHYDVKRLSISLNTKQKNNKGTHSGEKLKDGESYKEWQKDTEQAIIDELKDDIEKLDDKISKLYEKYLGKDHQLEG